MSIVIAGCQGNVIPEIILRNADGFLADYDAPLLINILK